MRESLSSLFIMEVKLENHEENVIVKLENESVIENLKVKLLIHESVVQEANRAPVRLTLVDPSAGLTHGIANIVKVEERVRRRRVTVVYFNYNVSIWNSRCCFAFLYFILQQMCAFYLILFSGGRGGCS